MPRIHLYDRRALLVELVPVRAPPARRVRNVVRDHQRRTLDAEAPQFGELAGIEQRLEVLREHHALVAEMVGVPFEPEERAEARGAVGIRNHLLHARPGLLQALEAFDEVRRATAVLAEVVPARMPGERKEVQVGARNVDAALDRPGAIAVRVVVVDVAVDQPVGILFHSDARSQCGCFDIAIAGGPAKDYFAPTTNKWAARL